ncbi:MAG: hypothetical protein O3B31_05060, partial [Chloroflexi bacterium]|nr:hypothetical protein [Chloroflexota bacterium]
RARAEAAAQRLRAALRESYTVTGHAPAVAARVGVASAREHGHDPDVLMRRGEMAMYVAQPTGGIAVYEPGQEEEQHSAERLALIGELRQAIDRGELALDCQPKVDRVTGVVVGAEALVRCKTVARRSRTLVLPRSAEASLRRHATLFPVPHAASGPFSPPCDHASARIACVVLPMW